jgi:hypothetical protein
MFGVLERSNFHPVMHQRMAGFYTITNLFQNFGTAFLFWSSAAICPRMSLTNPLE